LLIVRDEFPVGYSSIGLLSSRARLRFTNWGSFCYEYVEPLNANSVGGDEWVNWLSQPWGPPHWD
jgi:hypothetical protein